jgi:hypothetical protein
LPGLPVGGRYNKKARFLASKMKVSAIFNRTIVTALILLVSCVEPYDPPYSEGDIGFLVVDGFLDSGKKMATIKLSKAVPLDGATTNNPVKKAVVQVEAEDGSIIKIPETADGLYTLSSNAFQSGKKFKLRVNTSSKEYISDEVELRVSPSLDSVDWRYDNRGITVYLDAHDVAGSTRYYQWIYTETWEYIANKYSYFLFNKQTGEVRARNNDEFTWLCYANQVSTKVLVTTTDANTKDVVNDFPLTFIPGGDYRLSRLYSIEVEQRALDAQAYTYWLNLQKTTENLGGLFDPLPSEVTGNMRNVRDNEEIVLGYFSGGEIQKKRIFIDKNEVPMHLTTKTPEACPEVGTSIAELRNLAGSEVYLVDVIGSPPVAYTRSPKICVDCRERGGTLEKPPFWPAR